MSTDGLFILELLRIFSTDIKNLLIIDISAVLTKHL